MKLLVYLFIFIMAISLVAAPWGPVPPGCSVDDDCGISTCPASSCDDVEVFSSYLDTCQNTCEGVPLDCVDCLCSETQNTCDLANSCVTDTCGTDSVTCYNDGTNWRWRLSAPSEDCEDWIDNDCDGDTDGSDSDCSGHVCSTAKLSGVVKDEDENPIKNAKINIFGENDKEYSAISDGEGKYTINSIETTGVGTQYSVIVSGSIYNTDVQNKMISCGDLETMIHKLEFSYSDCKADCTKQNGICDRTCHSKNECMFRSSVTMNVCDPTTEDNDGHSVGHRVELGSGQEVLCCTGEPFDKEEDLKAEPDVSDAEDVAILKRVVLIGGEAVTMNVLVVK